MLRRGVSVAAASSEQPGSRGDGVRLHNGASPGNWRVGLDAFHLQDRAECKSKAAGIEKAESPRPDGGGRS
jgi:hypothetical protein